MALVHLFEALGERIALDVESGAIHRLDKPSFEVARRLHMPREALISELSDIPAEEVDEILSEIAALRGMNQWDSPEIAAEPVSGGGDLKAMCLHAAHDCDLRCRYCFAGTGGFHGPRGLLPLETGKRALDYLIRRSGSRRTLEVDFFGGEPMLNFDVVQELVAYGRMREKESGKVFHFTMTTNAANLSDDAVDFLCREMDNIVLSIDGRREVHDAMRPMASGEGSYDRVLESALRLAKARGADQYYARGTFTRRNLDFSRDVLALADAGLDRISVEPVVLPPESPLSLLPEHLPQIRAEYERLAGLLLERRKSDKPFSFFHFMVDLSGGPCLKKRLSGCGAGAEYVAVTPEGDVYPCHQFVGREGYRMGSVLDDTLDADLQARFARNHVRNKPACSACWAKYYCSGGCAANAQAFHGRLDTPYEMECEMERKRLECALAVAVLTEAAGENP